LSRQHCSWCIVYKPLKKTFSVAGSGSLFFCCALWIGLSASKGSVQANAAPSVVFRQSSTVYLDTEGGLKQRQVAFLNKIRKADPQHQTIQRAVFNEQNELGLIFNRNVEMDKIPTLMRAMLIQMARAFPGQDLTILGYAPSNPPRKIGTARLNAQTRDMTYTAEH
jgi:hypothetical protein